MIREQDRNQYSLAQKPFKRLTLKGASTYGQDFLTDVKEKNCFNYDFNNTVSHLEPLEQFDVE